MAEQENDCCKPPVAEEQGKEQTSAESVKETLQKCGSEEEFAKKKQQIQEALEEALLAVGLESLVVCEKPTELCEDSEQLDTLKGSDSVEEREQLAVVGSGLGKKGKRGLRRCRLKPKRVEGI